MTKNPKIHPVLLSGGSGTRLWPLSRQLYPKQLLPLASPQTLLQQTAARFTGDAFAPPVIIGNVAHRFLIAEQMREAGLLPSRIILEPVGRNTAPAAIIAALIIADDAPDDLLLLAPSDHIVDDPSALCNALGAASVDATDGVLLVFGVVPDNPHTGYGYIKASDQALPGGSLPVEKFVEKPAKSLARQYVNEGNYLWNAGMFLYRAATLIEEMERLDPEMVDACRRSIDKSEADLDFLRLNLDAFAEINGQSLDSALMEKTHRAAVWPIDVGWSDVGSWQALWDIADKDDEGNVVKGDVVAQDVADSYVRSTGPLVVAVGVRNLVIVATPDAVLVVPRARSEDIRVAVDKLASDGRSERETHVEVHRPWGSFQGLHSAPGYQVKRLIVNPGAAISLQYHNRRAEHWVVVGGQAGIRCGDEKMQLVANQSTYIPVGAEHQLENSGDEPLVVIEVQTGDYLGEDDIVRLEDPYGRG